MYHTSLACPPASYVTTACDHTFITWPPPLPPTTHCLPAQIFYLFMISFSLASKHGLAKWHSWITAEREREVVVGGEDVNIKVVWRKGRFSSKKSRWKESQRLDNLERSRMVSCWCNNFFLSAASSLIKQDCPWGLITSALTDMPAAARLQRFSQSQQKISRTQIILRSEYLPQQDICWGTALLAWSWMSSVPFYSL